MKMKPYLSTLLTGALFLSPKPMQAHITYTQGTASLLLQEAKSPLSQRSTQAIRLLAQMPSPESKAVLLDILTSGTDVRAAEAVYSLATSLPIDARTEKAIITRLQKTTNPHLLAALFNVLAKSNSDSAAEYAYSLLHTSYHRAASTEALKYLAQRMPQHEKTEGLLTTIHSDALLSFYRAYRTAPRKEKLAALLSSNKNNPLLIHLSLEHYFSQELFLSALEHKNPQVVLSALLLDTAELSFATKKVIEKLDSDNELISGAALYALRFIAQKETITALHTYMLNANAAQLNAALSTLHALQSPNLVAPLFIALLRSKSEELRYQGAHALASFPTFISFDELVAALGDSAYRVREEAAISLGVLKQGQAQQALFSLFKKDQKCIAALQSIAALGAKAIAPDIDAFLKTLPAKSPLKGHLLAALATSKDQAYLPLYVENLFDKSPLVRQAVLDGLTALTLDEHALSALTRFVTTDTIPAPMGPPTFASLKESIQVLEYFIAIKSTASADILLSIHANLKRSSAIRLWCEEPLRAASINFIELPAPKVHYTSLFLTTIE